ncbi:PTS transporter subunit EIIC [Levilactobacillus yiduensis]|uniref:PTS transporter subunit EIIC n=1 Tax=Levilactobacillus yiduensis TaxID=2953880 RepID=UPI000EF300DE|nr:PTS transporter subunit EIIC [Levilactobacillus yiduensis]AYM02583.1 PTS sugar transporter subunit IIC [Levilactobacillus brevis]
MQTTNRFARYLIHLEISWQHNRQIIAIRRALRLIFPLVLLGSLAEVINEAWLQTNGYYYQTLHVAKWVLQLRLAREYLRLISAGTLGLVAVFMAFAVSFYLVVPSTQRTTDRLMAGITAVISLKFFNISRSSVLTSRPISWLSTDLGLTGVLLGILVGLLVGNTYRWCLDRQQNDEDLGLTLTVTSGWLLGTAALGLLWISTQTTSINTIFTGMLRGAFRLPHLLLGLVGFSALSSLYQWLGMLGPITIGGQSMESTQNLAAVLNHHGWQLPHPITVHTIVDVYAEFGGSGMLLGLLLAIFIVRGTQRQQRVGWLSLVPTLGNVGAPLMVGLPVILSPLLGIPFLLAPLATVSLSWLCVRLAWVPAVAYPLATGAPGPLLAYLGTGGNWAALALALVDLALSTAIYYPFVKWQQMAQLEGGGTDEA